jgi:hypothetical protein
MKNHKDNIKDIAEHLIKAEFQIRRSQNNKNKEANLNSLNSNHTDREKQKE